MKASSVAFLVLLLAAGARAQNQRALAVLKDKEDLAENAAWVYDDLDAGFKQAAASGRPLMVVFR